jgi:hypothetical protein
MFLATATLTWPRRALGTPLPLLDSASGFFQLDAFIATQMTEGV